MALTASQPAAVLPGAATADPRAMSPKARWLAAIRMKAMDRLPFWPKLDRAYPKAQAAPFRGMAPEEIQDWIGSDGHIGIAGGVREVRKKTSLEVSQEGGTRKTLYRTPHGVLEGMDRFDEASQSWHPMKFPVERLEHIKRMAEFFEDIEVQVDEGEQRKGEREAREIGARALTANVIGESPLMHWVEWIAGVEAAHLLLADHREKVEALFEAMHRVLLRKTEIFAQHSLADVLYLIENTSTTLISPQQYRRYCFKHIQAYGEITRKAGRILVIHMCGHLKRLLPDLARLPADAFESFTSPTVGNTTLLDGRTGCPDKCLIGGTNAALWLKPAEEIIARIEKDLDALPHHRGIVVTSAGVMPPACKPETIRKVCEWVKRYPVRM